MNSAMEAIEIYKKDPQASPDDKPQFGTDYCMMPNADDLYNPFGPDSQPFYISFYADTGKRRTMVFKSLAIFDKWYSNRGRTNLFV